MYVHITTVIIHLSLSIRVGDFSAARARPKSWSSCCAISTAQPVAIEARRSAMARATLFATRVLLSGNVWKRRWKQVPRQADSVKDRTRQESQHRTKDSREYIIRYNTGDKSSVVRLHGPLLCRPSLCSPICICDQHVYIATYLQLRTLWATALLFFLFLLSRYITNITCPGLYLWCLHANGVVIFRGT